MKILLVCSSGGHFAGMMRLKRFWERNQCVWVTFRSASNQGSLIGQQVYWAFSPTNRHIVNLVRNFFLAVTVLLKERPDLIMTTGAGVSVPFLLLGRLLGCRVVFVESITRTDSLSLSARLVLPFSEVYVQWPELQERYPTTIYAGVASP
ncbi:MAG: UDP-N-acetylglucosamine--LPS N-acetylglucosamine transferase [Gemmatimonadaceae bacterium]|nr:UDP-N-acetylglucosamine--LPS N-acetylglucosamine transferase [Gloeobacterales cyanobacterium ES-bin-141]